MEPCTIEPRPLVTTSSDSLDTFSHFFTEELPARIVQETNRFVTQCLAAANSDTTWETDLAEIRAYLGYMVVMGVNRLPEIHDYWSTD